MVTESRSRLMLMVLEGEACRLPRWVAAATTNASRPVAKNKHLVIWATKTLS